LNFTDSGSGTSRNWRIATSEAAEGDFLIQVSSAANLTPSISALGFDRNGAATFASNVAVTGALDVTSTIGLIRINSSADLDTTGYGYIGYRDNSTGSYTERAYVGFGAGNGNFNLYSAAPGKVMTLGVNGVTSVLTISSTGLAVTGALSTTGVASFAGDDKISLSSVGATDQYFLGANYSNANGTESVINSSRSSWRSVMRNATTHEYGIDFRAVSAAAGAFTRLLTVTSAGNVGIGTTSPSSLLDIESSSQTAEISLNQTGASGRDYRLGSTGSGYGSAGNFIIYDVTAGAERFRINSSGNFAIPAGKYINFNGNATAAEYAIEAATGASPYDFRFIGSVDSGTQRWFSFGYYTSNSNASTWNSKFNINSYTGQVQMTNSDGTRFNALFPSRYGYSSAYMALVVGATSGNTTVCIGVDPSGNASGAFSGTGSEVMFRNVGSFICPNAANTTYNGIMSWSGSAVTMPGSLTVSGTITEASSITLKENLNPITDALDVISSLQGWIYDRKDGSAMNQAGFIAEEVEQVLPNVVSKTEDGTPMGVQYTKIIAYLVESVKELKAQIEVLKK
jgi:hypothetical protein